jgi:hypothetical protein
MLKAEIGGRRTEDRKPEQAEEPFADATRLMVESKS